MRFINKVFSKRFKNYIGICRGLLSLLTLCDSSVFASQVKWDRALQKVPNYQKDFSIFIGNLSESGSINVVFALNENKLMIPASVTKLVTAYFVLDFFGPSQTIKNKLFANADKLTRSSIRGPIVFRGAGDPGFVSESMWSLVNDLFSRGYREIIGDIWVDASLFDESYFDDSRLSNRANRAYDAPVSSVSFNWNSVNFHIFPSNMGERAYVHIDPQNDYILLENKLTTKSAQTAVACSRTKLQRAEKFILEGNIDKDQHRKISYCPVQTPPMWFGYNLKSFLLQRGIRFAGDVLVKSHVNYDELIEVGVQESKPISAMVADMNKFSNNYVAEMLLKLVSSKFQVPASLGHGVYLLNQWLEKKGIDTKEQMKLINPSGLTRENYFTARALHQLLVEAYHDFKISAEFVMSLPIGGVDGTLKDRFEKFKSLVRAKTGYLNHVISLAGYFQTRRHNKVIPFVFLYNGPKVDEAKNAIDQTIQNLIENL